MTAGEPGRVQPKTVSGPIASRYKESIAVVRRNRNGFVRSCVVYDEWFVSMSKQAPQNGTIKTAHRVFDTLELVRDRESVTLSEVAEELDIATSTAHGYLTTLEDIGYLVRDDGRFHLSLTFIQYGKVAKSHLKYLKFVEPVVEKIADETGEVASFVAEENGEAVFLLRKEGSDAAYTSAERGKQAPLHATAAGKVILANQSETRIEELTLSEHTNRTITDVEVLHTEIDEVREEGLAYNDREYLPGLRAVSCPVYNDDELIGTVTVGGPAKRLHGEIFHQEIPALLRGKTNEIELNLNGTYDI